MGSRPGPPSSPAVKRERRQQRKEPLPRKRTQLSLWVCIVWGCECSIRKTREASKYNLTTKAASCDRDTNEKREGMYWQWCQYGSFRLRLAEDSMHGPLARRLKTNARNMQPDSYGKEPVSHVTIRNHPMRLYLVTVCWDVTMTPMHRQVPAGPTPEPGHQPVSLSHNVALSAAFSVHFKLRVLLMHLFPATIKLLTVKVSGW